MKSFDLVKGNVSVTTEKVFISNDQNKKKYNAQLFMAVCGLIYFSCTGAVSLKHYFLTHETLDLGLGAVCSFCAILWLFIGIKRVTTYSSKDVIHINEITKIKNIRGAFTRGEVLDLYLNDKTIRRLELKRPVSKIFLNTIIEKSSALKHKETIGANEPEPFGSN